ncbi:MAG: ATP F0F1 synthase subunit B [Alphaproteobacteria bacterium]|nr:ATP F0F1 synthase subunit B [Alphaproteobacteria bacterium]
MEFDNSFWATVGLVIFIGIAIYAGMPRAIVGMLDSRIRKIEDDLNQAKRLREEAQALLADYGRRRKEAEAEAADIITAAQEEAKRMRAEAEEELKDMVIRRTKAVEDRIAHAEATALSEVRSRSADVAIEAARSILTRQMAEKGDELLDASIKNIARDLN